MSVYFVVLETRRARLVKRVWDWLDARVKHYINSHMMHYPVKPNGEPDYSVRGRRF